LDAINLPVTTVRFWLNALVQHVARNQTPGLSEGWRQREDGIAAPGQERTVTGSKESGHPYARTVNLLIADFGWSSSSRCLAMIVLRKK